MLVMEQVVLTNHVAFVVNEESHAMAVNWLIDVMDR
jgi:hypothetical protein